MAKRTVKSHTAATQKWSGAMASPQVQQNYQAGISAVQVSPMQQAATPEAMNAYVQGVQNSVQNGKRAAALNAGSLGSWQAAAKSAASGGALARGAAKGQGKYQSFAQKAQPFWQQASDAAQQIARVPGDLENAAQRWRAAAQVMASMKGQMK